MILAHSYQDESAWAAQISARINFHCHFICNDSICDRQSARITFAESRGVGSHTTDQSVARHDHAA